MGAGLKSFHRRLSHNDVAHILLSHRTLLMEGKGSLEDQLEAVKRKVGEISTKKETLRKVEELGASTEEALIFDNKYVLKKCTAPLCV